TVIRSPENGGTLAWRMRAAMHPPVTVPANGGPATFALMARPEVLNVTVTLATPLGSPSLRPLEAERAAALSADDAAFVSNGPGAAPVAGAGSGVGDGFGLGCSTLGLGSGEGVRLGEIRGFGTGAATPCAFSSASPSSASPCSA